jgi:DNA-binding FrmR family transcriptional regulator
MNTITESGRQVATPEADRAAELAAQQRKIVNRLRRAEGQLAAVIRAVESGAECRDIVIQLSAVSKALDRAGYAIVASAMRTCIAGPEDASMTPEELEKLFLTLA